MNERLLKWAMKWQVPAAALDDLLMLDDLDEGEAGVERGRETTVVRACRLAADRFGGVLWRNNSGATFDRNGRMIRYGLGNDSKKLSRDYKSSDLVGIAPGGRFMAVECKHEGWTGPPKTEREIAQANFGNHVRSLGGLFTFATDPEHVRTLLAG